MKEVFYIYKKPNSNDIFSFESKLTELECEVNNFTLSGEIERSVYFKVKETVFGIFEAVSEKIKELSDKE